MNILKLYLLLPERQVNRITRPIAHIVKLKAQKLHETTHLRDFTSTHIYKTFDRKSEVLENKI